MQATKPRRRWGWRIAGAMALLFVAYVAVVIMANRAVTPTASMLVPDAKSGLPDAFPPTITLATWNVGFAALGAEGDAISDGGTHLFPESGEFVQKNLDGIVATLKTIDSDMLMLQEVSQHSLMSWWRPVYDSVVATMPERQVAFRPDIFTTLLPFPLAIDHGTVVALEANPRNIEIIPLPLDPKPIVGFIKRRYAMQVVRVPIEGSESNWVIVNLHLSPFDEGGALRRDQIAAVLDFAEAEYANGEHVILGGDWNTVLFDPKLPSTTPDDLLTWVVDFPREQLLAGWSIVAGEGATVRTTDKPYVEGENYRTGIDGFVVSPNVSASHVGIIDIKYAFSDHMPVTATFTAN
jgi:endonuclease/exonuclease/phosphatase family metal-dependent hydrolase